MKSMGFMPRPEYILERCPYCRTKLSVGRIMKRKILRMCKCGKCGKLINERHMKQYISGGR